MPSASLAAPDALARNSTLPLWMYVATSAKPCFSKQALSAAILIRLLPPTLIPRSSATYRDIDTDLSPAGRPERGIRSWLSAATMPSSAGGLEASLHASRPTLVTRHRFRLTNHA